jgi:hypothetical protein
MHQQHRSNNMHGCGVFALIARSEESIMRLNSDCIQLTQVSFTIDMGNHWGWSMGIDRVIETNEDE